MKRNICLKNTYVCIKKILLVATFFTVCLCMLGKSMTVSCSEIFDGEISEEFSELGNIEDLTKNIIYGKSPDYKSIAERMIAYVFEDIKKSSLYVSVILGLAMLSAFVKGTAIKLPTANGNVAFLIIYSIAAAFLLGILKSAMGIATETCEKINSFVKMAIPTYVGIISTTISADIGNLNGIFIIMINVLSGFVNGCMLKTLFYIGVLHLINNMSSEIHILKITETVSRCMFWILGLLLTVFAAMTGLSGITVSATSKVGMNAVKYTMGHSVPIIGGFFADTAEVILSSAVVLKNAFGMVGIIALFAMCLLPAAKLFVMGTMLKLAAGLAEPFCDKRISNCTYSIGCTIIHIMISLVLLSVMFVFAMAVILALGTGG